MVQINLGDIVKWGRIRDIISEIFGRRVNFSEF